MEKENHIFDELSVIFSRQRLDGYLVRSKENNDKWSATAAYSWNIQLCQSLYPSLQIFEIVFRNSLHNAIAADYKTEAWFELALLHKRETEAITQAKKNLRIQNKLITPDRIVAELSLGFWTSLLDIRYEHEQILWPRLIKPAFPYLPRRFRTRQFLSKEINLVRKLRNRIFHYEPIWHWKDLPGQHQVLLSLVKYISPIGYEYLLMFDRFQEIHFAGIALIKNELESKFVVTK